MAVSGVSELRRLAAQAGLTMQLSVVVDISQLAGSLTLLRGADLAMVEIRLPSTDVSLADLRWAREQVAGLAGDHPIGMFFESAHMLQRPDEAARLADRLFALRSVDTVCVGGKLRTGGVTSDLFPSSELVACFVTAMHERGIPWKATAGLHHPVRGVYNGQPMHGFLNVLGAACGVFCGALGYEQIVELLDDADSSAFGLTEDAFTWRSHRFAPAIINAMRRETFRSFGSCSFDEPVEGLLELRMLGLE